MKPYCLLLGLVFAFDLAVLSAADLGIGQAGRVLEDATDVQSAVDALIEELEDRGNEVVLVVNHAAAAASVNLDLRPTQVILARPHPVLERLLLRKGDTFGLDLPLKFLVFEDANGVIHLAFNSTGYLADRHGARFRDPALWLLDNSTKKLGDDNTGVVTIESQRDFDDTVTELQEAIGANDAFRIPLVLDFGEGRKNKRGKRHRSKRQPTLIVFGNPNAGTPLMQASQNVAIDLPQKFLVWEDDEGGVQISYNDPFFVAKRNGVEGQDQRLTGISNALANFANAGANTPAN